jgi:hypothetical protein
MKRWKVVMTDAGSLIGPWSTHLFKWGAVREARRVQRAFDVVDDGYSAWAERS